MKRTIVLMMLTAALTFAPGKAFAYPNGPCAPRLDQSTTSGLSQVQLFLLVVPALVGPIV